MNDLSGKVAVVTGAASGIGRAMAERFGREGMKVVLADIEEEALARAVKELRQQELAVEGVVTDVARGESVEALAQSTLDLFGKVHLLCNNAGVFLAQKTLWEASLKDWDWILGVNMWGIIHGIRSFVPLMLAQDEEGWVINTASQGGLVTSGSIYGMTKHAAVALSEALYTQLKARQAKVGVSVLCPNFVDTRLMESERNRPAGLWNPDGPGRNPLAATWIGQAGNIAPATQAEMVVDDLRAGRFYMFPYMEAVDANVRARFDNILDRTNPEPSPLR